MFTRFSGLLFLVVLTGCGALRPGVQGSGISKSEYRQVPPFQEVDLSGFGTVNVFAGQAPSVEVVTDDNLLSHVDTFVDDGELRIKTRGMINPRAGLNVNVTVPQLTAACVSGAGNLNLNHVCGEHLDLTVSGAGSIDANGQVNQLTTKISGAGEADLRELHSENANVRISGAGDASVYASQSLEARISGAGDVVCYGNPLRVNQDVSGAGDLEIKNDSSVVGYTIGDHVIQNQ